jgi:hypothetical protein
MLDNQKRQAEKAKGPKKEVVVDQDKIEAEKKAKLDNIEEGFFKVVAEGDSEALNEIRARGDGGAAQERPEAMGVTDDAKVESSP